MLAPVTGLPTMYFSMVRRSVAVRNDNNDGCSRCSACDVTSTQSYTRVMSETPHTSWHHEHCKQCSLERRTATKVFDSDPRPTAKVRKSVPLLLPRTRSVDRPLAGA